MRKTAKPDFTALCLRPSARTTPPIAPLLKTKTKPQFERTVDRAVEALFLVFPGSIRFNSSPCLLILVSGRQRVANGFVSRLSADC